MNVIKVEIATKRSNLFPVINKIINDEWEKLRRDQIEPWIFLNTEKGVRCKDFYGKEMKYQGVTFEGSPHVVFWGRYIEPFLEDISFRAIDQTIRLCNEKSERLKEPLLETAELLKILIRKTYDVMADVDRRLRGGGFPRSVEKRNVDAEIAEMFRFIDARVQSEIIMHDTQPKIKNLNEFYHKYQFLLWLIGILISIVGIVLKIAVVY